MSEPTRHEQDPAGGTPRRILLVHAHPDDESLGNGATMARYAAQGHHVTLVTCTRGEEGLVLVPDLAHLASDRDDRLGEHREGELAAAMAALGVDDHRFLDTVELPGVPHEHYRDSGMAWDAAHRAVAAPDTGPEAFARADLDRAAARVASVVREVRPHAVVTYEPGGGYGHPDHVQAHRVAMRGVELAGRPGPGGEAWQVPKVYWNVLPEGLVRAALAEFAARAKRRPAGTPTARCRRWWCPTSRSRRWSTPSRGWTARSLRCTPTPPRSWSRARPSTSATAPGSPSSGWSSTGSCRAFPRPRSGRGGRELDLFAGLDAVD